MKWCEYRHENWYVVFNVDGRSVAFTHRCLANLGDQATAPSPKSCSICFQGCSQIELMIREVLAIHSSLLSS